MLQERDQLLEATAKATNVLLTLENLDEAINTALKVFLEGAGCDRLKVIENNFDGSSTLPQSGTAIYEYTRPGMSKGETNFFANWVTEEFIERYFLHGEGFCGLLEEWGEPIRSKIANSQAQSACAVPIRVNGQWWGVLTLNYSDAIQIDPAEFTVLRMIADCIGSVIQRERLHHAALHLQQERQQAAQQRTADLEAYNQMLRGRDRLLEASAKAANVLLTVANFDEAIMTAFEIIGQGMGCDRLNILENSFDPDSTLPICFNYIYEWAMPDFVRSSAQLEAAVIWANQLDARFLEQYFLSGDGFGGLLEVWPEPLRNSPTADQVQSAYSVPIRVNGQWWGVLSFHYCRAAIEISPVEVSVLMTISDCIGSAIQHNLTQKLILQAEQNRALELTKANDAMRRSMDWLARDPDMDAFLGHLLQELAIQFDAQDAQIVLYNAQERTLQTSVALIKGEVTVLPPYSSKTLAEQWDGWEVLLRSPRPRPFSIDTEPHLFLPSCLRFYRSRGHQGIVCTLLRQDEQPLGFIEFAYRNRGTFSDTELELVQSLAQQATLAIQLTRLAEEAQQAALLQERTRMAREIHDTLAQAFGGILMQLQAVTYFASTQPEQAQTHLLNAQALAQEGLTEARRSVWNLYLDAAEYEDLARAIAKFIEQNLSSQAVPINLAIDGTPYPLHPDLGLNLLRIAQESITNALRHAQTQSIQIYINYSVQALQLSIRDDGCGFEPQSPTRGFGLLGMQQRAARIGATWHLTSQPGQGTTITVSLPHPQTH
jgi:signal transduction histidine kinase